MELIKLSIPYEFARLRVHLSWRDVLFGLDNQLLDPTVPVEMAIEQLGRLASQERPLINLSTLGGEDSTRPDVEVLASAEQPQDPDEIQTKFLYLVLDWVFTNKTRFSDPLGTVEEVYADFGYPERVARFVRYMPSDEADLGSRELNEQRLYGKWHEFLNEMSTTYRDVLAGSS